MFPSQTSLIPVTVALARFLETNGLWAFSQVYPYWYLGSTPYKFLIGPVTPSALVILHKILPLVSLFDITMSLIILSFLFSAGGWGLLTKKISGSSRFGVAVGVLTVLLPYRYLPALALDEASFVIARNLLPFTLLAFWKYLGGKNIKRGLLAVFAVLVLLLTNASLLPSLLVGVASLISAASFDEEKTLFRGIFRRLKFSLLVISSALIVVSAWYTPAYWLTVLFNPSIGGAAAAKVIWRIFDLIRFGLPLLLAFMAVKVGPKLKNKMSVFSLVWVGSFVFLTVLRFIGDPDFWMDWTAWFWEIEIGLGLLISKWIYDLRLNHPLADKYYILLAAIIPFFVSWRVYTLLGKPTLLSSEIPHGVRSLEKLAHVAGDKRVFLSGSTVFWANAFYDIHQVRGGRDQVAIDPNWDKAAYELREGDDPQPAEAWLGKLNIDYILVHGPSSLEFYHDFKNIGKWDAAAKRIFDASGDIYFSRK